MKTGIHPTMFANAKTTCSTCKSVFLIPSTIKEQSVEVCRMCHPIYTGKQQKEARGGRIDRFRKRMAHSTGSTGSPQAGSGQAAGKGK